MSTKDGRVLQEKPHGALSMLFWLKHDNDYNEAFHKDELYTLEKYFGIPADHEIAQIMLEIGHETEKRGTTSSEEAKEKMKLLFMKLCEKYVLEELFSPYPHPFW